MSEHTKEPDIPINIDVSDEDIYEAMKEIEGYLDITPSDLKEIYRYAYRHALDRITRSVKAGDIMTRNVFAASRQMPLKEVAEIMARERIAGLPVLDDNRKVAGVISEKDFLARMGAEDRKHFMGVVAECLKGKGCVALSIRAQKAEDIMTAPAITVYENTPVSEIARLFSEKEINRVPVTDKSGVIVGIVSRADLIRDAFIKIT